MGITQQENCCCCGEGGHRSWGPAHSRGFGLRLEGDSSSGRWCGSVGTVSPGYFYFLSKIESKAIGQECRRGLCRWRGGEREAVVLVRSASPGRTAALQPRWRTGLRASRGGPSTGLVSVLHVDLLLRCGAGSACSPRLRAHQRPRSLQALPYVSPPCRSLPAVLSVRGCSGRLLAVCPGLRTVPGNTVGVGGTKSEGFSAPTEGHHPRTPCISIPVSSLSPTRLSTLLCPGGQYR